MSSVVEESPAALPIVDADAHLSPAKRAQRQMLKQAMSRPIHPSPLSETPQIRFAGDLVMMIGEEAQDAGAWATVYRGPMSRSASSVQELENVLPQWLLEFALHNIIQVREPVKIAFVLEPWGGPEQAGLAELPSGLAFFYCTCYSSDADTTILQQCQTKRNAHATHAESLPLRGREARARVVETATGISSRGRCRTAGEQLKGRPSDSIAYALILVLGILRTYTRARPPRRSRPAVASTRRRGGDSVPGSACSTEHNAGSMCKVQLREEWRYTADI